MSVSELLLDLFSCTTKMTLSRNGVDAVREEYSKTNVTRLVAAPADKERNAILKCK